MATIKYHDKKIEAEQGETVLDALLRHDVDIPYACKAGVCHVCVMICDTGELPDQATLGLNENLVKEGNFLACQCIPEQNVSVKNADERGLFSQSIVVQKVLLNDSVCRLRLRLATQLYYRAGQFINLKMSGDDIRSYSLASLPTQDDFLELYVKKMTNGKVSNWLYNDIQQGDTLDIQGPYGDSFYKPGHKDKTLLMIATGTGLTPIIGIVRDALDCGHSGDIHIYHGVRYESSLYYQQELNALAHEHANLHYYPCISVSTPKTDETFLKGHASTHAFSAFKNLENSLLYLCGSPQMVEQSKAIAIENSANPELIFIDPFVTKDLRSERR